MEAIDVKMVKYINKQIQIHKQRLAKERKAIAHYKEALKNFEKNQENGEAKN